MTAFEVNSSEEDNEINFYHQRSCPSCQRLFYCECDPFKMTLKVLATFSKKQCSIEVDSFVINILNKNGIDSCWLITVKSVQYLIGLFITVQENLKHNQAVFVAQLVDQLFLTPDIRSSYPVIGNFFPVNCIEKTKIKKKRPGTANF